MVSSDSPKPFPKLLPVNEAERAWLVATRLRCVLGVHCGTPLAPVDRVRLLFRHDR
jgi:hypothetical protein